MKQSAAKTKVALEAANEAAKGPILDVTHLKAYFFVEEGIVRAVNDISFSLKKGETLGIVGESGCGKSVTSLAIMGLVPMPPGKIMSGSIIFKGRDLVGLSREEMTKVRGKEIAMIFQEPMTALNPVLTVGFQIEESLEIHTDLDAKERRERAISMLETVGIPEPSKRASAYPHELSGGMRQRVMIAMALACDPSLLIADEPTTALDVTIQAQILELMREMRERYRMSLILITHDLSVIAETVDNVAVMYAGLIVEYTDVRKLFRSPLHPYTAGLLDSIPVLGRTGKKLIPIRGRVPNLINLPKGCYFSNRCPKAMPECFTVLPELREVEDSHSVRCLLYKEGEARA
jgi:peptide/nickel transport system ATP-binding protein